MKPLVAIVGRANVGKSTLFNKLVGNRISIVDDVPGVTRDRLYADTDWTGHYFTIIDTGGIQVKSEDTMYEHIHQQVEIATDMADVIVFVVDGKQGILAEDYAVAKYLRETSKPIIMAVNKIDNLSDEANSYQFYELGFSDLFAISASQGKGIGDLLDAIVSNFKEPTQADEDEDVLKIAVVGKPNAGKSSLVNKILGYQRVIVTNIPGTTRDAIDTPFTYNNKKYLMIDTAGIRKKSSVDEDIEYYSVLRAFQAVRRADVVIVVIDAESGISEQDVKILGYVDEQGKPSIIAMNKWDLIEKDTNTIYKFKKDIELNFKFASYIVSTYISALTGKRVQGVLELCERSFENSKRRISTSVLNEVINRLVMINPPPLKKNRQLKIYYATQVSIQPPSFVIFVNDETSMHFSYKRYIENGIREAFDFTGTPIKIIIRNKLEKDKHDLK